MLNNNLSHLTSNLGNVFFSLEENLVSLVDCMIASFFPLLPVEIDGQKCIHFLSWGVENIDYCRHHSIYHCGKNDDPNKTIEMKPKRQIYIYIHIWKTKKKSVENCMKKLKSLYLQAMWWREDWKFLSFGIVSYCFCINQSDSVFEKLNRHHKHISLTSLFAIKLLVYFHLDSRVLIILCESCANTRDKHTSTHTRAHQNIVHIDE